MTILSNRVLKMKESATLAMARKSRELKEKGADVITLSLGEPDFDTPDNIKEACKKALDEGNTKYTPVSGIKGLKEAICRKLKRDNQLDYSPNQIVVSAGAKQSIANACLALLNPGDELLVPSPYWVSYSAIGRLAEAHVVEVKSSAEEGFKPSAEKLEKHISDKTKVILYSSPCNPSGAVYNYDELKAIAELLKKYPKIHVISDEIYEHIIYSGKYHSLATFEEVKDRVVLVNGFSKAYAMTGWRLGFLAASTEIASACDKIQGQITSGTCNFNQMAAIEALDGSQEKVRFMVEQFKSRRSLVLNRLKELDGVICPKPDGAFYVFPDIRTYFGKSFNGTTINDSEDLAMYLLEEANVAVVGGKSFGDANCIRISFAASEEMINKAFDRMKVALEKLA